MESATNTGDQVGGVVVEVAAAYGAGAPVSQPVAAPPAVFLWTPPHFWALALSVREDYERAGIPMLPVVRGEATTHRQILAYGAALVAFTAIPYVTGVLGGLYLTAALVIGSGFIGRAAQLCQRPSRAAAVRLHLASLAYLALLFAAMAADRLLTGGLG